MRNPKTFHILRVVEKSKRQVKFVHLMIGEFDELSETKAFCENHELGERVEVWANGEMVEEYEKKRFKF